MVRSPGSGNWPIITCGEQHLEETLNEIFAYQINAWFDVIVKTPTVYEVSYDVNHNYWMNATDENGNTAPDAAKIIAEVPKDPTGDIHIYYTNYHVAEHDTPGAGPSTPDQGSADIHAAAPKDGNNIFVGPWSGMLPSDVERTRLLAHEIGHVMCGSGHPDTGGGQAPLVGTNRMERLLYTSIGEKMNAGLLYKNLLVKAEWDKAEGWLEDVPDKRWRKEHGIIDQNVPTGNY
jgi:hypothetical protein